jgi:hypothetical protein
MAADRHHWTWYVLPAGCASGLGCGPAGLRKWLTGTTGLAWYVLPAGCASGLGYGPAGLREWLTGTTGLGMFFLLGVPLD